MRDNNKRAKGENKVSGLHCNKNVSFLYYESLIALIIILYTLNLHSVTSQGYVNKARKNKMQISVIIGLWNTVMVF